MKSWMLNGGRSAAIEARGAARRAAGMFAILLTAACSSGPLHYQTASLPAVPGADADILANVHEKQSVTELTIEIENLPPPDRVTPGSTNYVAWYRKDPSRQWARIAALDYDPDKRVAKLVSSVPEVSFALEISAEAQPDGVSPSPSVVFAQQVSKK